MPSASVGLGPLRSRSAEELNAEIRAMFAGTERLRPEQRKLYQERLEAWARAVRGEVVEAA